MKNPTNYDPSLELCYQALASQIGIVISVSDFISAQQKLYSARKKSGDTDLDVLQFRRSPTNPEGEIWIVKSRSRRESPEGTQSTPPPNSKDFP
jgi:hypothetical protein